MVFLHVVLYFWVLTILFQLDLIYGFYLEHDFLSIKNINHRSQPTKFEQNKTPWAGEFEHRCKWDQRQKIINELYFQIVQGDLRAFSHWVDAIDWLVLSDAFLKNLDNKNYFCEVIDGVKLFEEFCLSKILWRRINLVLFPRFQIWSYHGLKDLE